MKAVFTVKYMTNFECRLLILFNLHQRTQFLLNRIKFSLGTEAFASPTDMASSGVWKIFFFPRHPPWMVCVEYYPLL